MTESPRLFFAVWPGQDSQEKAANLAEDFRKKYDGRAISKESLHITLAFLGETLNRNIPQLIELAQNISNPSFQLALSKVGYFNKGIFWLGPDESPSELLTLVANLRKALVVSNITFDKKEFVPHMTLLRNAECKDVSGDAIETLTFPVRSFVLAISVPHTKASKYKVITEFPLED